MGERIPVHITDRMLITICLWWKMEVYAVGNGQLQQARLSDKVGALNCMHDQQMVLIGGGYMEDKVLSLENHPNDSRIGIDPQGKVQTLSGKMGTGGNNTPMAMVSYGIDSYNQAIIWKQLIR